MCMAAFQDWAKDHHLSQHHLSTMWQSPCCKAGSVSTTLQHITTFVVDLLLHFEAVIAVHCRFWFCILYSQYKAWSQEAVQVKKLATFFCHAAGRPRNHKWELELVLKWHKTEYHLLNFDYSDEKIPGSMTYIELCHIGGCAIYHNGEQVPSVPFRRMFELCQGLTQRHKRDWH